MATQLVQVVIISRAIICILIAMMAASDVAEANIFSAVKSREGCAVDEPLISIPMTSGSALRCGDQCRASRDSCLVYQYNKLLEQYQLYNFMAVNWMVTAECKAFLFTGEVLMRCI
jgi:hypothetical protein